MKGPVGGTARQRLPTYQRTSSVPSSTARSSPASSTGDRDGLFARIDQLEMTGNNLAAENDVLEKKIRPHMEKQTVTEKAQPASIHEALVKLNSQQQNDDIGRSSEHVNEVPRRSTSATGDHASSAASVTLVQTISDLQNKVLALEAELSQEKQCNSYSKAHTPMRRLPTPQMTGSTVRVGSPPRQKGISSPRGCSPSTQKQVQSPRLASPRRNSPSPSRASSKSSLAMARSPSEEALLGWYRQQKPAQRTPERFRAAKVRADRAATEKSRRLRTSGTGNCPGYQRPTAASNAGRPTSSTRFGGQPNRSLGTPQRWRSKSPSKHEEVEDPFSVGLWESLNRGLALTTPDKGHWICGDRCMRGEHFEPYRPVVPTTTGNFLFKAAPPGVVPGAPTGLAKERTGTCTPPWARASATASRGRLACGDISVSDATTPRVSVVELTAQIASQLRDRFGALEVAATHAAVALGLCDSRQINDYILAHVRNGFASSAHLVRQSDTQVQMGSRSVTLAESSSLSELHKALPPIRFTVDEFEECLIDFFKLTSSRKDVRRIFHMVDKSHGRVGLIELPHLADDYQHVADELEASLTQRSLNSEQRSIAMRAYSPEDEEHNAVTVEEARQRRRSPRSQIVAAVAAEMPASGATLVEHANAVLLSTLRTEDLSARQTPRRSPSRTSPRGRGSVSPVNRSSSLPTAVCTTPRREPLLVRDRVCEDNAVMDRAVEVAPLPPSSDSDETSEPVCFSGLGSSSASGEDNELARLTSAELAPTENLTEQRMEQFTEQSTEQLTEQPISFISESVATHAELVPESPAMVQTVHNIAELANLAKIIHSSVATVRPPRPPMPNDALYDMKMPMKGDGGFSPPTPSGWSTPSQVPSVHGSQAMFATPGCTPQTGGGTPASCVTPSPTPPAPPPPTGFPTVIPPKGMPASAVGPTVPRMHTHGWDTIRNRVQHGGLIQIPSGMSPRVQGGPFPYPAMR